MTGFAEVQFPPDISYGSSGGPEYTTDIVISSSGHEQRNVQWSQARLRYNVAKGVKSKEQLATLIAFFRARKGRAYGFRFKDWSDYSAASEVLGTGNGTATSFQLVKRYISGSVQETRPITKPVAGTVKVYKGGVLQNSGVSVNMATGLVTFTVAPLGGVMISADFEFDVPVRFDTDRLAAGLDSYGTHSWADIPLVEVRV
jgi:uncharacterized protein (TIGR02217 family)